MSNGEWTRFSDYVKRVAAVEVQDVARDWGMDPPGSLAAPDLPAKFVRIPLATRERYVFCVGGEQYQGSGMMTVEVVVCIEAVNLDLPISNTIKTAEMGDHILHAYSQAQVGMSWPEIDLRQVIFKVAGIDYWALVARVTARG